jgi:abhydrolase domain-containing protein 4
LRILKSIKTQIDRFYVNIRNNSMKIWTMSANKCAPRTPIVLVHGFCGAIALWAHNVDVFSESRPFYAFDLLGFGRSSRPLFSGDPIVAETQFIESIEDWRKQMNINEMILLGHSFGGYLVTAYALKYPAHVKALILADPWGFQEKPSQSKPDTPMPLWISMVAKISQYISPLSVFRVTGPVGVSIFKHLRPDFKRKYMSILDDPEIIYSYIYHANRLNPTGEAGFRAIAEYFGYAKNPMIRRIEKVKFSIPIWFIYGSRSWIDSSPGFAAIYIRQRFGAPIFVKVNTVNTNLNLVFTLT